MKLSKYNLKNIVNKNVSLPSSVIFELPERVIQFGTGMLLRGLPDYFIDKANREGVFNGRIVVVKSTSKGNTSDFEKQDCLYTICERGVLNGVNVEEKIICSAISRVLNANSDWEEILNCAHNPELKIIISNTTEMGLKLVKDDIRSRPPVSFPGKLLSFLHKRYSVFNGVNQGGLIIIPTELLPDNGKVLESIVLELAHLNGLDSHFIEWLGNANHFCGSLVDRIVIGMPPPDERDKIYKELGYEDGLLTVTEVYNLWAIEGVEKVKNELSFCRVNEGVKIEQDINIYRELKLRLLNATHTLSCGISFLGRIETVLDAMNDREMSIFIENLMREEISPAIPLDINSEIKHAFINSVLDRFRNPHLRHRWKTIAQNYSEKMKLRCVPVLVNHYKNSQKVLPLMTFGFAAWIHYMRAVKNEDEKYYGKLNEEYYLIEDQQAGRHFNLWQKNTQENVIKKILGELDFWRIDLLGLPGFCNGVIDYFKFINESGMKNALKTLINKNLLADE